MDLLRKLQRILPRSSLLTRYKAFIGSRLDYADAIDDKLIIPFFNVNLNIFSTMHAGNNWCNKKYLNKSNIPRTRFRIP